MTADIIVLFFCAAPVDRVGVGLAAYTGNGTGCSDGGSLAMDQAGDGGFAVGQGSAVIFFFRGSCPDSCRGRGHGQSTGRLGQCVIVFIGRSPVNGEGVFYSSDIRNGGCGNYLDR